MHRQTDIHTSVLHISLQEVQVVPTQNNMMIT